MSFRENSFLVDHSILARPSAFVPGMPDKIFILTAEEMIYGRILMGIQYFVKELTLHALFYTHTHTHTHIYIYIGCWI